MKRALVLLPIGFVLMLAACAQPIGADLTGKPEVYIPPVKPVFPKVEQPKQPEAPVYEKVQPLPVPEKPVFEKVQQNQAPAAPAAKQKYVQTKDLRGQKAVPMDILFVVDTSQSMCAAQRNLSANINKFVDAFLENDKIDFQIGVTVSWDSRLYGNAVRKFKNGELRPVVGQGNNVRFITPKTPNVRNTLANTLKVGFEAFNKTRPDISGPEDEELFSPALAALSDEMLAGPNMGFRRPDAHLAVVIVTDTDDSSPDFMNAGQNISSAYVAQELKNKVRGDATITVLAALARYDEMVQFHSGKNPGLTRFSKPYPNPKIASCSGKTVDPGLVAAYKGPARIANLVQALGGEAFDLSTSAFGGKMAGLGQTLLNKAMSFKVSLDKAPDVSEPILVKINGKGISRNDKNGWSYVADSNTIILNEGLALGGRDKFQVEIEYYPL